MIQRGFWPAPPRYWRPAIIRTPGLLMPVKAAPTLDPALAGM